MFTGNALARPGDIDNGKILYDTHCVLCHGLKGEGDGVAAERLARKPRDFTQGVFKLKTTPPEELLSRDEDIFMAITSGSPSSGMPAWEKVLSEKERWDLVAYVKSLSDLYEDEENPAPLDYSGQITTSPGSIARGKEAFFYFRCHECHGANGDDSPPDKVLKDDYGRRIWPEDLTKPWRFLGPNDQVGIYSRVTVGIPLTPMRSFVKDGDDIAKEEKKRWDLANYVFWLAEEAEKRRMETYKMVAVVILVLLLAGGAIMVLRRRK